MKQIIVDNFATNYYISENGECYNSKTGRFLKGQISNSGYLNYNLTLQDGVKKRLYAHRLVAIAYIDNVENKPEVNHIDGNKLNNNVTNLEWVTTSENQKYNVVIGHKSLAQPVYQFDANKNLVNTYLCEADVERAGYTLSVVQQEVNKSVKTLTLNYYWSNSADNNFSTQNYENTGKAKIVYQYDKDNNFIAEYPSTGIAAKAIGGTHSHIGECCRGKIKTYKGYIWRYDKL